jgi:hypothetical protein
MTKKLKIEDLLKSKNLNRAEYSANGSNFDKIVIVSCFFNLLNKEFNKKKYQLKSIKKMRGK